MTWQRPDPGESSIQIGISIYQQPLKWVEQCVNSALGQATPGSLTVTVRTDGPEACSTEVFDWLKARSSEDPRLELIDGQQQLGTYGSYRTIFEQSNSTFLCQLDADDWLEPEAVAKGIASFDTNRQAPFVYTLYQEVDRNGCKRQIGARSKTNFSQQRMLVQFITYHLRIIRRNAYNRSGAYNTSLLYTGDYDLSLRLCELGEPIHVAEPLYNYRLHGDNTSSHQRQATIQEAFTVAERALTRRRLNHVYKLTLDPEASRVNLVPQKGPILITGMHRSGTSLLALMLQQLGMSLGSTLLGGDKQNPDGYGEDLPLVSLQRTALQRRCNQQQGWPDWGWVDSPTRPHAAPGDSKWREQALQYLKERQASERLWGWKDPRTTLFLDQWLELAPGLRVIAIYRDPWEVVDALQRLKPPVFAKNPAWALKIWLHYNQALLRFLQEHPERCLLIHSSSLKQNPGQLIEALQARWGWTLSASREDLLGRLSQLIRQERLQTPATNNPLASLHQACSPAATTLLQSLDALATLKPARHQTSNSQTSLATLRLMQRPPQPELSIVITSHNQGDFLLEAVASAEAVCKDRNVQLLIVDDGSSQPRTAEVLHHLEGLGYRILRQPNQGLSSARNTGTANTSAPILLFLDDDNRLLPPYLEQGLDLMHRHHELEMVYGNRQEIGTSSNLRRIGRVNPEALWQMNRIDNCTLIRRTLLERTGGYDPALPAFEDWDLWLTAMGQPQGLRLGYIDMTSFEYRVRPDSMLQRLFASKPLQQNLMRKLRDKHGWKVGHGGFGTPT